MYFKTASFTHRMVEFAMSEKRRNMRLRPLKSRAAKVAILSERALCGKWRHYLKLHLSSVTAQKVFTAHGAGYVTVSGQRFEHPVVVTSEQIFTDWQPQGFDALDEAHFTYFLDLRPDVLLLGTGVQQQFPHPRLYQALIAAGIGVEFMNTPAACRTYNILLGEDRKVVAGILL